jgi:WD40 repeat protein
MSNFVKRMKGLPSELCFHTLRTMSSYLAEAKQMERLKSLLTNFRFIEYKILTLGIQPLLEDYSLSLVSNDPNLIRLRQILAQSRPLLARCETLNDIAGTLHSRLTHNPDLLETIADGERDIPLPLITAHHPLPDLPNSKLSALIQVLEEDMFPSGCAISGDGKLLVSANWGNARIWDVQTGQVLHELTGHTDIINNCAISLNGDFVLAATGSPENHSDSSPDWVSHVVKVWDTYTGTERLTLVGHTASVNSCAISADGSFIVSTSSDNTLMIWDAHTGVRLRTLVGHTGAVQNCAISADGAFIVSASSDNTLKVWDTVTGMERLTLRGHVRGVSDCAVSSDNSFIVSASSDNTLKVWDALVGTERLTLSGHNSTVSSCVISSDDAFIVSTSFDKTVRIWDSKSGKELYTLRENKGAIKSCAVSRNGILVSVADGGTIKIWDTNKLSNYQDDKYVQHIGSHKKGSPHIADRGVISCDLSSDGSILVSAASDKTVKVWHTSNGRSFQNLTGHTGLYGTVQSVVMEILFSQYPWIKRFEYGIPRMVKNV